MKTAQSTEACSISEFAETMKHNPKLLTRRMKIDRLLQDAGRPYSEPINRGYFIVREGAPGHVDIELTGKGQIWLARKYPPGCDLRAGT